MFAKQNFCCTKKKQQCPAYMILGRDIATVGLFWKALLVCEVVVVDLRADNISLVWCHISEQPAIVHLIAEVTGLPPHRKLQ